MATSTRKRSSNYLGEQEGGSEQGTKPFGEKSPQKVFSQVPGKRKKKKNISGFLLEQAYAKNRKDRYTFLSLQQQQQNHYHNNKHNNNGSIRQQQQQSALSIRYHRCPRLLLWCSISFPSFYETRYAIPSFSRQSLTCQPFRSVASPTTDAHEQMPAYANRCRLMNEPFQMRTRTHTCTCARTDAHYFILFRALARNFRHGYAVLRFEQEFP